MLSALQMLSCLLPDATQKNFFLKSTTVNEHIWKLKEFRNNIIHTKQKGELLAYDSLLKTSLKLK